MTSHPIEALTRVTLDAARRHVPIEIVARSSASSLYEAATNLGIQPHQLLKTLVLKRSDGTFLFALIPGDRAMSWPKLREVLQVNKLSLPQAEVALEVTGYHRGTITPFGSSTALPVVIDSSVIARPATQKIALGSGDPYHAVFVTAQDLVNGFDATVADISVPEAQ